MTYFLCSSVLITKKFLVKIFLKEEIHRNNLETESFSMFHLNTRKIGLLITIINSITPYKTTVSAEEFIQASNETLSFIVLGDWGKGGLSGIYQSAHAYPSFNQSSPSSYHSQDQTLFNSSEIKRNGGPDGDRGGPEGGHKESLHQVEVARAMGAYAANDSITKPSFVVAVGDNFYDEGVPSSTSFYWNVLWKDIYLKNFTELNVPWYPVFGNHDYGGGAEYVQAQIDRYHEHTDDDIWMFESTNYTKRFSIPGDRGGSVAIVFIDTTTLAPSVNHCCNEEGGVSTSEQYARINNQLFHLTQMFEEINKNPPTWLLVAGHYPVYSVGEEGDVDELITYLTPLLNKYNVHAYFCGHDHMGEHLRHENSSVEYFVSGAGSMNDYFRYNSSAKHLWLGENYGSFTVVDATVENLTVSFIDVNNTLRYQYTLTNPNASYFTVQTDDDDGYLVVSDDDDTPVDDNDDDVPVNDDDVPVEENNDDDDEVTVENLHESDDIFEHYFNKIKKHPVTVGASGVVMLGLLVFLTICFHRRYSRYLRKQKPSLLNNANAEKRSPSGVKDLSNLSPKERAKRRKLQYVELMELGGEDGPPQGGKNSILYINEEDELQKSYNSALMEPQQTNISFEGKDEYVDRSRKKDKKELNKKVYNKLIEDLYADERDLSPLREQVERKQKKIRLAVKDENEKKKYHHRAFTLPV